MVKLGEVSSFQNGFAFKSSLFKNEGEPIIRISNIQDEKLSTNDLVYFNPKDYKVNFDQYRIFPNDILIAMSGGTTGKLGINQDDRVYYQNQRVGVIREKADVLCRQYLYYFLQTKTEESLKIAAGAAQPNLSTAQINNFDLPLPPLEEQHRIVSILDASFEKIDALKKNAEENLKNAKAFYDKLLIEKFSHKEGWIKSTLQDECFKITDGTHQTPKYFESGHIFLSSGNVTNRKIDWDNIKFIDEQQHQEMQKRVSPKINDILLAKNGTTGVAALVDRDVDFDIYVSLALLRTLGRITPQYMYYFVNSPIAKSQFNKRLKGAGVPNLHLTEIRQVEISYPKDIKKQNEIVKTIENIDEKCRRLEEVAQQTIRECDALKQSILRQAFSGEL